MFDLDIAISNIADQFLGIEEGIYEKVATEQGSETNTTDHPYQQKLNIVFHSPRAIRLSYTL
jgi:hypothetical protein